MSLLSAGIFVIQIRIQDNTTMEFQQNINFNSITDEIWEFLVWYEIFSYECPGHPTISEKNIM